MPVWQGQRWPDSVTVFDLDTLKTLEEVKVSGPVPDKPEFAVDDGAGRIYANIESEPGQMLVIDSRKLVAITNAENGHAVARVPIGEGPDAAAYDAKRGLVFSSNGEGTLSVVLQKSADRYSVIATVPTQRGARTMALDPESGRVYLVTAEFGPTPTPTAEQPHPRPPAVAASFTVLVVGSR